MIKQVIYLLLFILLFPLLNYGQIIKGEIINQDNLNPISFANILIKDTHTGTVSNNDGKFELSSSKLNSESILIISAIGFKTTQIPYSSINLDSNLIIKLQKSVVELQEVVITYLTPKKILEKFYKNYSSNYYQGSSLLKAYYHSTLSENKEYKHLLEATVNIKEFNNKKKHRKFEVEITQRRKSNDYRIEKWGEKNNYLFDAIASNPTLEQSDFLNEKNQSNYDIKRIENTSYNEELIYVIQFIPKKESNKPLYTATAYFNSEDFALIKAEYSFKNTEEKIKNQSLKDKTYHIPFISGSIQYQKTGNYYTQKYLTYTNGWTVINNETKDTIVKDILRDEVLFVEAQYDFNSSLTNPLNKWGDIYQKPFPYDAQYWNSQTKIPESVLFEQALEDLEKHQSIEVQYFNNSINDLVGNNYGNSLGGKIDSILSIYHFTNLFNGVVLVSNEGRIIHHKAYGYKNIDNKIELDTSTLFDIGSITKQFTTAIILKLRALGKLNLEDKIERHLPYFKYANQITIHQLLAHRSGIPTYDFQNKLENSEWFKNKISTRKMVEKYCSNALEFEPDSQMEYSNSNFIILTAIIEEIESKDYYSVLNELILQPLKMDNTHRPDALTFKQVSNGYILEGDHLVNEPVWEKSNSKGAGCIYSNSSDLLKWLNAYNSSQFLTAADQMLIQSPISYYDYYNSEFGYSWAINKDIFKTKKRAYFYGGTSLGFYSMITIIPENGINVILLNNTGNFPRIEITNEILKILE